MLLTMGVQSYVCTDIQDSSGLRRALGGCAQLVHICPPMHPAEDRIADNLIALSQEAGVERFILYSVLHPVIGVPHHLRKLAAEKCLIESGINYTIVQPSRYMQHLAVIWKDILENSIHAMPFSTTSKFSLVDLADLADAVAKIVCEKGHNGASYQLAGPEQLDQEHCAQIISRFLGRPVRAARSSPEIAISMARKAGWPDSRLENLRIMNAHYDRHGLIGNSNILSWILGRKPATFADYVAREMLKA